MCWAKKKHNNNVYLDLGDNLVTSRGQSHVDDKHSSGLVFGEIFKGHFGDMRTYCMNPNRRSMTSRPHLRLFGMHAF